MPISLNGDGVVSGVSTLTNPSEITVGTGASVFSPATNVLALGTNSAERVRIDADGNFNLVNTAGIMTAFKYETPALINNHFKSNSTSSGDYVRLYAGSGTGKWDIYGNAANLRFSDNDSAGNIQMDRPLVMNSQNIVMSSGNGIDFSATSDGSGTTTSELLDDYEEGTFTPVIIGSTTTGTATYAAQRGKYTKVGNRVFWEIYISWTGGTGTGDLRVSGLPFTISNTLATFPTASIGYAHNVTTIADHQLIALQASGDTYVYFYQIPSGGGVNVGLAYDASGTMILSGDYNVA